MKTRVLHGQSCMMARSFIWSVSQAPPPGIRAVEIRYSTCSKNVSWAYRKNERILVAIVVTLVIAARASDGFCLNFSTSN